MDFLDNLDALLDLLRIGNIVAVIVPGRTGDNTRELLVCYVTSVWKSNKQPKLVTTKIPVHHCVAFRCVWMEPMDSSISTYRSREASQAFVLRPEALVAVLAPSEDPDAVSLTFDHLEVKLSGDSVAILDELAQAPQWWPLPEEDDGMQIAPTTGLFVSGRRRKAKRASGSGRHAKDAPTKGSEKEQERKKEKKGKEKKAKKAKGEKKEKKEKLPLLKRAKKEKMVPFDPKHCRRNGCGPILVAQMMLKLRGIEEEKFHAQGVCFDIDGRCVLNHEKCRGRVWDEVAGKAHDYFCAQCLSSGLRVCHGFPMFSDVFWVFLENLGPISAANLVARISVSHSFSSVFSRCS